MEAKLDASDQTMVNVETNEQFHKFEWVRQSEISANRKLQCTVTSMQTGTVKYSILRILASFQFIFFSFCVK